MPTTTAAAAATTTISNPTRDMWRSSLGSAFRTALACTIVGCTTLYGPIALQRQIAFPALSYVVVIIIVTDATLGDTLRGCWYALYGTIQGVLPAMLCLWVVGPTWFSGSTTALAVALSAFVIALPKSTHLITKRIALAQIVLVYAVGFINDEHTEAIMQPVHVAASTAIGALASVLALVLPYPRLSYFEVQKKCKLFGENASGRLTHLVNAFCAEDNISALDSLSQALSLAKTGAKLLLTIKQKQASMQWEIPRIRVLQSGDRLQVLEVPLRGMEIALTSCSSFPLRVANQEHKDLLLRLKEHISLTVGKAKCYLPCHSSTQPNPSGEVDMFFQTVQAIFPIAHKDLPSFFFVFCMKFLHDEAIIVRTMTGVAPEKKQAPIMVDSTNSHNQDRRTMKEILGGWVARISSRRVMVALKCSFSLGLAVLFGLAFSKENGFWSGLAVATSFTTGRDATFKVANVRAQGTALGTIYGVIGCFIFQRFLVIRFLSLLPWIIFASFLRQSQMYDQAGGISAIFAALIILGRKGYGPPSAFAIARITETFIGLACSIMVELLFRPTRAAVLAKIQLSKSFRTLHECVNSIGFRDGHTDNPIACLAQLKDTHKKLRSHVSGLGKFIKEAEVEPNFWFLPFHSGCYNKLLESLSKMVELLLFGAQAMDFLKQESQRSGVAWKELQEHIDGDLELFKDMVGSSVKCLEVVTSMDSLPALEKELEKNNISVDLELGKSPNVNGLRLLGADEDEMEKIITSFLQHSREVSDKIQVVEGKEEIKSLMVLCLSALAFCISDLMKETRKIENGVKELIQWENPSCHIDLYEISCKINALHK